MANNQRLKLFNALKSKYNIGSYDEFDKRMNNADDRRRFYDKVSEKFNLGDFDSFESRIKDTKYHLTVGDKSIPVSEKEYKDFAERKKKVNTDTPVTDDNWKQVAYDNGMPVGGSIGDTGASLEEVNKRIEQNGGNKPVPKDSKVESPFELNADKRTVQQKVKDDVAIDGALRPDVRSGMNRTMQVADRARQINANLSDTDRIQRELDDVGIKIEERTKEINDEYRNLQKENPYGLGSYDPWTHDEELMQLRARQSMLDDAMRTAKAGKETHKSGGFWDNMFSLTNWDNASNNLYNFYRGAKDVLTDPKFYTMGVGDLNEALQLKKIKDKVDNGEELTDEETSLGFAAGLRQQMEEEYGADLSHMYKAGQTTADMAPFMAQIAMNPAGGLGKALGRAAVRKYGRYGAKAIATRVGGRIGGDLVSSLVLANTLQGASTAADAINRYVGDAQLDVNDSGNLTFNGFKNGMSGKEAAFKAISAATIENFTEEMGEWGMWTALGEKIGATAFGKALTRNKDKFFHAMNMDNVNSLIFGAKTGEWSKAIEQFKERTKWSGNIGEVMEEEYGIILNSMITGDNNISDLWDKEQQIDIVLGVGMFGGFMSGVSTGAYVYDYNRIKNKLKDTDRIASFRLTADRWSDVKSRLEGLDGKELDTELGKVVMDMYPEEAKAVFDYYHAKAAWNGFNTARELKKIDGETNTPTEKVNNIAESAVNSGASAETPEEIHNNAVASNVAELNLLSTPEGRSKAEILKKYYDDGVTDVNSGQIADIIDGDPAAKAYFEGLGRQTGMQQKIDDEVQSAVDAEREFVSQAADDVDYVSIFQIDGEDVVALRQDGNTDEEGNTLYIYYKRNGEQGMCDIGGFDEDENGELIQKGQYLEDYMDMFEQNKYNEVLGRYTNAAQNNPNTITDLQGGTQFTIGFNADGSENANGMQWVVVGQNEQTGAFDVAPQKAEMNDGQVTYVPDLNNVQQKSADEIVQMQNDFWDASIVQQINEQNAEGEIEAEGDATSRTVEEGSETSDEETTSNITEDEEGEPVFDNASEEEVAEYFNKNFEGADGIAFIQGELDTANEILDGINAEEPKDTKAPKAADYVGKPNAYRKAKQEWEQQNAQAREEWSQKQESAQKAVDRWNTIRNIYQQTQADKAADNNNLALFNDQRATNDAKDEALGDSQSFDEYIAREAYKYRYLWKDKRNGTKGLASHLFGKDDAGERAKRLAYLSNTEGLTPEEVAHDIAQHARETGMFGQDIDETDVFNKLLDVLRGHNNRGEVLNRIAEDRQRAIDEQNASQGEPVNSTPTEGQSAVFEDATEEEAPKTNTLEVEDIYKDDYERLNAQQRDDMASKNEDMRALARDEEESALSNDILLGQRLDSDTASGAIHAQEEGKDDERMMLMTDGDRIPYNNLTIDDINIGSANNALELMRAAYALEDDYGVKGAKEKARKEVEKFLPINKNEREWLEEHLTDNSADKEVMSILDGNNAKKEENIEPAQTLDTLRNKYPDTLVVDVPDSTARWNGGYLIAVDEDDNASHTFYHGTQADIKSAKDLKSGMKRADGEKANFNGDGISFTPSKSVALDYANGDENKVVKAHIKLNKPYYTHGVTFGSDDEGARDAKAFTDALKALGYDGIINLDTPSKTRASEVIVFDNNSIEPVEDAQNAQEETKKTPLDVTKESADATRSAELREQILDKIKDVKTGLDMSEIDMLVGANGTSLTKEDTAIIREQADNKRREIGNANKTANSKTNGKKSANTEDYVKELNNAREGLRNAIGTPNEPQMRAKLETALSYFGYKNGIAKEDLDEWVERELEAEVAKINDERNNGKKADEAAIVEDRKNKFRRKPKTSSVKNSEGTDTELNLNEADAARLEALKARFRNKLNDVKKGYEHNDEVYVKSDEYAAISHIIATNVIKHTNAFVFTANNCYLCTDIEGDGNFKVRMSLPIVGNEDYINKLRDGNKDYRDTSNIGSLDNIIKEAESLGGYTNWNISGTEGNVQSGRNASVDSVDAQGETNGGNDSRQTDVLREDEGIIQRARKIAKELEVEPYEVYGAEELERVFNKYNTNNTNRRLASKVFNTLKEYGVEVVFAEKLSDKDGKQYEGYYSLKNNRIVVDLRYISGNMNDAAATMLHESIHAVTSHALNLYRNGIALPNGIKEACEEIIKIFDVIKYNPDLAGEYGVISEDEMIAELARPSFRRKLMKIGVVRKIVNAVARIIGINVNDANTNVAKVLEEDLMKFLDGFTPDIYNKWLEAFNQGKIDDATLGKEADEDFEFDPEVYSIGTEMAQYYIKGGKNSITDFANAMVNDFGDAVRPYITSLYDGARQLPSMKETKKSMSSHDEVDSFDSYAFDKSNAQVDIVDKATNMVKEQKVKKNAKKNGAESFIGDLFAESVDEQQNTTVAAGSSGKPQNTTRVESANTEKKVNRKKETEYGKVTIDGVEYTAMNGYVTGGIVKNAEENRREELNRFNIEVLKGKKADDVSVKEDVYALDNDMRFKQGNNYVVITSISYDRLGYRTYDANGNEYKASGMQPALNTIDALNGIHSGEWEYVGQNANAQNVSADTKKTENSPSVDVKEIAKGISQLDELPKNVKINWKDAKTYSDKGYTYKSVSISEANGNIYIKVSGTYKNNPTKSFYYEIKDWKNTTYNDVVRAFIDAELNTRHLEDAIRNFYHDNGMSLNGMSALRPAFGDSVESPKTNNPKYHVGDKVRTGEGSIWNVESVEKTDGGIKYVITHDKGGRYTVDEDKLFEYKEPKVREQSEDKPKTKDGWLKLIGGVYKQLCEKYGVPEEPIFMDVYRFDYHITKGYRLDQFEPYYEKYKERLNDEVEPASDKQMDFIKKLAEEGEWKMIQTAKLNKISASYVIAILKANNDAVYNKYSTIDDFEEFANELEKVVVLNGGKTWESVKNVVSLQNTDNNSTNNQNVEGNDVRISTDEERTGGQQPVANGKVGGSTRNAVEGTDGRAVGGRNITHTANDREGSSGLHGVPQSESNGRLENPRNTNNNHAERGTDYAPKSPAARFKANLAAIKLMKQLVMDGKQATPQQMEVLRKFSGWGGLGQFINNREEIGDILTDEEYDQAVMSINSAYYTPSAVIDAMWDIARKLGFKGGRVLEGSAGIGNIIGLMPTDMSERSNITAVEIDSTTGNILKLLYPDADVQINGFENTKIANASVDLAITNVPFVTGLRVKDDSGDKDLSTKFHNIHDFCIAKNVRKLRPGGIGIFISSSGTLDKSTELRKWVTTQGDADFISAFRLNNETFGGAPVTSDIIIVRRRVNGQKSAYAEDLSSTDVMRSAEYDTGEKKTVRDPNTGKKVEVNDVRKMALTFNSYFVEHPENMGGEMAFNFEKGVTRYPTSTGLFPVRGVSQMERLNAWVERIKEMAMDNSTQSESALTEQETVAAMNEKLGEGVKEGSLILDSNGNPCVARMGVAVPLEGKTIGNKVKGRSKAECIKMYDSIKTALAEVLDYQAKNADDSGLTPLIKKLNAAYDKFTKAFGRLSKNTALSFLKNDVDFSSIAALEKVTETGDKEGNRIVTIEKTDVFSKRVVGVVKDMQPKTVADAVVASIFKNGYIDTKYIADKLGISEDEAREKVLADGHAFENPLTGRIEVDYEYLSGNVRQKLADAHANNDGGRYNANIKALEKVKPMDIPAHLIEFNLGSNWIDPKIFADFIEEMTGKKVKLMKVGGTWTMGEGNEGGEKNKTYGVYSEVFRKTIWGTSLIEAAMRNTTISVTETHKHSDGTTETIKDKDATTAANNKVNEIRAEFREWAKAKMQSDPELAARIERKYNDMFNNYVPKSIPESYYRAHLDGSNHAITLYPHQSAAVTRAVAEPLLLAHEVGTGKTFTLISTAMEMRRLGTAKKPMIVVQNATVGQFVKDAKLLYPNAKVLSIEDSDRTAEGRKNFYAKIKYNDWDMIVVPQSVFERIPDAPKRQVAFIEAKIAEKMAILEQMKEDKANTGGMVIRQAEKEVNELMDELLNINNQMVVANNKKKAKGDKKKEVAKQNAAVRAQEMLDRTVDDVENFDDMDVDAILVDEAHEYKHLGFATAMQRGVKGVDPSYSKKSQGVYLKCQAVKEKNNGRNVVFATGTPISNTAAEVWTFMKYLMPEQTMKDYGIYYFDDFVRNFGNISMMLEFTTSGSFKENNRFAGYVNTPELIRIWNMITDTVLTEDAGKVNEKIPKLEGGKAQDIFLPQSKSLRAIMKSVRTELEAFEKMDGKEKAANSHIPLVMYGIASKASIDPRLVWADAPDEPLSKTNRAVDETLTTLEKTKDYKGTVAIFCDSYRNKQSGFNVYEEIKRKLVENGVPAEQVFIMKSGMSVKKKQEIFDKVNAGEIRVILGSTQTLGTGVNIQERLNTLIHMDVPNRPMDYTQRNGRILRQGNLHKQWDMPVRVLRFGVEDSLDVTGYQRLKTKGAIADSIMKGKQMLVNNQENRTIEEEEDMFGDAVATLSGSEFAMLKNQAEREYKKYENKKKQWEADQVYITNTIRRCEGQISADEEKIAGYEKEIAEVGKRVPNGGKSAIEIGGKKYAGVTAMDDVFKEINKKQNERSNELKKQAEGGLNGKAKITNVVRVGELEFVFTTMLSAENKFEGGKFVAVIHRETTYTCDVLGLVDVPVFGGYVKNGVEDIMDNIVTGTDAKMRIAHYKSSIEENKALLNTVKNRKGKPFEFDKELEESKKKVEEYSELMQEEMAKKEAKYANDDVVGVDLKAMDSEEDEGESTESEESGDEVRFRRPSFVANNGLAVYGGRKTTEMEDYYYEALKDIATEPVLFEKRKAVRNAAADAYKKFKNKKGGGRKAWESVYAPVAEWRTSTDEYGFTDEKYGTWNFDENDAKELWKMIEKPLRDYREELINNSYSQSKRFAQVYQTAIDEVDYAIKYYEALANGEDVFDDGWEKPVFARKSKVQLTEEEQKKVDEWKQMLSEARQKDSEETPEVIRRIREADKNGIPTYDENRTTLPEYAMPRHYWDTINELKPILKKEGFKFTARGIEKVDNVRYARAWHGSAADFDRFDLNFAFSGEGSMVNGYGVYVAELRGTAERYANVSVGNSNKSKVGQIFTQDVLIDGKDMNSFQYYSPEWQAIQDVANNHLSLSMAKESARRNIEYWEERALNANNENEVQDLLDNAEIARKVLDILNSGRVEVTREIPNLSTRKLYEVEIPDDTGDNYLVWNEDVSEEELEYITNSLRHGGKKMAVCLDSVETNIKYGQTKGRDIYEAISIALYDDTANRGEEGNNKAASKVLSSMGYAGMKVPTGYNTNNSNKHNAFNYVIFNEDDVKIVSKTAFRADELMNRSNTNADMDAMESKVQSLADELNVPVRIVRSYDEVDALEGISTANKEILKREGKGFYNTKTGEVVIFLPNNESAEDACASVLHEIVGHKGLRQLVGEKEYNRFLAKVYSSLPNDVRADINRRAEDEFGWDIYEALDEMLAEQAEKNEAPTWWENVKVALRQMLRSAGINLKLSDNDVKYLLWQSKNQLMKGDIVSEAESRAMRARLGIGTNSATSRTAQNVTDEGGSVRYRKVEDNDRIAWFDKQPKIITYKTVAIDEEGDMHAPMADNVSTTASQKGKVKTGNYTFGDVLEAEEHPELADEKGKIKIIREDGKPLNVAYDPYDHSSDSKINDQFKSAWERDNLVVIRQEIPESEIYGKDRYHAEKALLPTGRHNWKKGVVGNKLSDADSRHVYLSRWSRPIERVDWQEVADEWIEKCLRNNISVPFNVVPKAVRDIIADAGVNIIAPEKGMGQNCFDAYEEWKNGRPTDPNGGGRNTTSNDKNITYTDIRDNMYFDADTKDEVLAKVDTWMDKFKPETQNRLWLEGVRQKLREFALQVSNENLTGRKAAVMNQYINALDYCLEQIYLSKPVVLEDISHSKLTKNDGDIAISKITQFVHNIHPIHSINDYGDILKLYDDGIIDKYELANIKNELEHPSTSAFRSAYTGNLYVFPRKNPSKEYMESTIVHEIVHDISRTYNISDADKQWVTNYIRTNWEEVYNRVVISGTVYPNEEAIAYTIEYLYKKHGMNLFKMTTFVGDKHADATLLKIINYLNGNKGNGVQSRQNGRGLSNNDGERSRIGVGNSKDERMASQASQQDSRGLQENERHTVITTFTDGTDIIAQESGSARDMYERTLQQGTYKFKEAWQDSMQGLRELMKSVMVSEGKTFDDVADWENAYMAENLMSSVNQAEFEAYRELVYNPMLKAVDALVKDGATYDDVKQYIISKHGLERNEVFAMRDANRVAKESIDYDRRLSKLERQFAASDIDEDEYNDKVSILEAELDEARTPLYEDNRLRDYSGLTALYKTDEDDADIEISELEARAQEFVDAFETEHDTTDLWDKIDACNDMTLSKQLDGGLIDQVNYDMMREQFEYYVPLRGFDDTTSDEVYDYLQHRNSPMNEPVKAANGRKSLADDPLATIGNMAESGIMAANRNLMKQKFLNFAQNHKSDILSVSDVYLKREDTPEGDRWVAIAPEYKKDMSGEQMEQVRMDFESWFRDMQRDNPNDYKKGRDAQNIPYRTLKQFESEHLVFVKRAGKTYMITVNGNPRAAQAINGLTNPHGTKNEFWQFFERVNRFEASMFTNRNPAFVLANFSRDAIYANSLVSVKEDAKYARRFRANWAKAIMNTYSLVKKYKNGTLNMADPFEKAFHDFIMNGGETGFTSLNSVNEYRDIIMEELKDKSRKKLDPRKALKLVDKGLDNFNRWAEDSSRFAAFLTSREMGRSMQRSIYDGKEITVNFNKKGAGNSVHSENNKFNPLMAQIARESYIFFNAGVQGVSNVIKAAKKNPKKFAAMGGIYFTIGMMMPIIGKVLSNLLGGDDDDYWDIPEYVRRNNLCLCFGGVTIKIPLPIELRMFYGLGELAIGQITGYTNYRGGDTAKKVAEQISQVAPIDMMEGGGGFGALVPSYIKPITEIIVNKDWTGVPIEKCNDFNKEMPNWTKAYKGTSPMLVNLSQAVNEWTGGDDVTKGAIDLDPAWIDHLWEGYFGGFGTTLHQMMLTAEMPFNKDVREMRNAPIVNRFITTADTRAEQKRINTEYFENKEYYDEFGRRLNGYKNIFTTSKNDPVKSGEYLQKFLDMTKTDDYTNYIIWDNMGSELEKMQEISKQMNGSDEIEDMIFGYKKMMNEMMREK